MTSFTEAIYILKNNPSISVTEFMETPSHFYKISNKLTYKENLDENFATKVSTEISTESSKFKLERFNQMSRKKFGEMW